MCGGAIRRGLPAHFGSTLFQEFAPGGRPESGPRPAQVLWPQGPRGARQAGGGEGPGTKAAVTALRHAGAAANFGGGAGTPHARALAAHPRPEEPAPRWSAAGCRLGRSRPSPPGRRPHRPLPRLRPLPPSPERPRRLRARRIWRRRRSGGTLYLSTGPMACAGTAASSSSSATRESGDAGGGAGRAGVPGRADVSGAAAALTGAPLSSQ